MRKEKSSRAVPFVVLATVGAMAGASTAGAGTSINAGPGFTQMRLEGTSGAPSRETRRLRLAQEQPPIEKPPIGDGGTGVGKRESHSVSKPETSTSESSKSPPEIGNGGTGVGAKKMDQ
jgi:hypothetical protein